MTYKTVRQLLNDAVVDGYIDVDKLLSTRIMAVVQETVVYGVNGFGDGELEVLVYIKPGMLAEIVGVDTFGIIVIPDKLNMQLFLPLVIKLMVL